MVSFEDFMLLGYKVFFHFLKVHILQDLEMFKLHLQVSFLPIEEQSFSSKVLVICITFTMILGKKVQFLCQLSP